MFVDSGDYLSFNPIVLSGADVRGDDEGLSITGPTGPGVASLANANPLTRAAAIELDDADNVTIANLDLSRQQRGVWAHNGSLNISLEGLRVDQSDLEGIRLEDGGIAVQNTSILGSGSDGLFVSGGNTETDLLIAGLTIRNSDGDG